MNLQSDDFELFGLPRKFAQERSQIDARWKELQREAHPDRFAARALPRSAWPCNGRCASTRPISASRTRSSAPPICASWLARRCAEDNTAMPAAFLMQQMEWREALEDAASEQELDALEAEMLAAKKQMLGECGVCWTRLAMPPLPCSR
jgi:molecular chaperone HscB